MTHQRNYRTGRIIVKISLLSAAAGTISHPLDAPPPLTCAEYQQCFDPHLFSSATASLASLVSSFIAHSINHSISSIGSFCALPMRYISCSSNLSHIVLYFWVVCPLNVLVEDIVQLLKVEVFTTPNKFVFTCSEQLYIKVVTCWVIIDSYSTTMFQTAYGELNTIAAIF